MEGVAPRTDDFPPRVSASITMYRCLPYVDASLRCFVRTTLHERGREAWYEIVATVGAAVDNRRGIDVTSVNEGANIARSIVTIITAGNWPIVVYARVKYRFLMVPYVKFAKIP